MEANSTPPPLPSAQPSLEEILGMPVLLEGKPIPGTEGLTLGDVELDVLKGGRFLTFPWNISVIVLSYRRHTGLVYVPAAGTPGGHALGWGLFSLLFGWWGFPWGLIYTPASLWTNATGGKDHTQTVLTAYLGETHAREIMSQSPARKPDALLWTLRGLIAGFVGLIAFFIWQVASAA